MNGGQREAVDSGAAKRQRLYRVSGVVLRRRELGEADRLLTVFTREEGKVTLLAKGVRRAASRKAGHIEPFTYTEFLVAKGANLDLVTQAETIEPHRRLREDLWLSSYGYYVAELTDAVSQDADPNGPLFDLLLKTLAHIDAAQKPGLAVRYFEVHALALSGFQPQLHRCVQCDELLKPEVNFLSLERGGCLCPRHGANLVGTIALPLDVLKVLRYLQTRPWEQVVQLELGVDVSRQVETILGRYIVWHLERTLRSPAFIEKLRSQVNGG